MDLRPPDPARLLPEVLQQDGLGLEVLVRGVLIQPSAERAIQAKVFGPPPAPMITGTGLWTGLG